MSRQHQPAYATEITANGLMWNWTFTYSNGYTDKELHLVVNKPTNMILIGGMCCTTWTSRRSA